MKKILLISISLILGILGSSITYGKEPKVGEPRAPRLPLTHVTQGYETDAIELNRGLDGQIHSIEAKPCPSCPIERYKVTPQSIYYVGTEQVSIQDISKYNGQSGAISYYPNTNELQHLRYFNLEAAQ